MIAVFEPPGPLFSCVELERGLYGDGAASAREARDCSNNHFILGITGITLTGYEIRCSCEAEGIYAS
jgi:hypothetical protein